MAGNRSGRSELVAELWGRMQVMVFFEGLDKTGKTTLYQGVRSWRRDRFTFFDRGPWSRHVLGGFYRHPHVLRSTASLIGTLAHQAAVVHVVRDVDTLVQLQRGAERHTRPQLETQLQLFLEAFAAYPPAHLITLENAPGLSPAAFIDEAKARLSALPEWPRRAVAASGDEGIPRECL